MRKDTLQQKISEMKKIIVCLAAVVIAISSAGQTRKAVVNLSEVQLREDPKYTAELGTQALMGTVVEIVESSSYWRKVITSEPYTAWCTQMGLVEMSESELASYLKAPKCICTAMHSTIREKPNYNSQQISDLSMGGILRVVYSEDNKVVQENGWLQVMLPDGRKGWVPGKDTENFTEMKNGGSPTAEEIIETAERFIGIPYLWGGTSSKGVDCSGLTRMVWFMNGVLLPRNASQQARVGQAVTVEANHSIGSNSPGFKNEMLKRTQNLKPGDLVFFGRPATAEKREAVTHVAIYIGDGKIIHSAQVVRINSLIPGTKDYYSNSHKMLKARRIIGWKGEGVTPVSNSRVY